MPRKYIPKTNGPNYSKEDLANAVQDVQNRNMSYRGAQEYYNVPISVISQRLNGRKTAINSTGRGRKTTFTYDIEKKIVDCLLARAKAGFPCDKNELLDLIQEYVKLNNLETQFIDSRPGSDWYYSFLKRHTNLSLKKPEHLQQCRKDARRPQVIYSFYEDLCNTFTRLGITLLEQACFVLNADETGFKSDPSRLRAIGQKGKPLSRVSGGSGRESTTVLACVGADGSVLPPLVLFKGAAVQARWVSEKAYPGTLYAVSKNGWMEEAQFFTWFSKGFIPHVKNLRELKNLPNQAAVLIYDGHASHISVRIVEEAISNNITLIRLPSHLTDMLQPLDKCVFGPVKTFWEKKLIAYGKKQMGKGTGRLSKMELVTLLAEVWTHAIKPTNIISGFKNCGIFPVDKTKFPLEFFGKRDLDEYLQSQDILIKEPENNDILLQPDHPIENLEVALQLPKTNSLPIGVSEGVSKDIFRPDENSMSHNAVSDRSFTRTPTPHEESKLCCKHLPTETCTSSCTTTSNTEGKIVEKNMKEPSLDPTLTKLFFKSPEKKENVTTIVKAVIPRLKRQTYGEILTTEDVLGRLKEAQEKKDQKSIKQEAKKRKSLDIKDIPTKKQRKIKSKNKKKREKESSSEEDSNNINIENCLNDSDSPWDWETEDVGEELISINPTLLQDLKTGSFVLATFKGGKRNTTIYKYVCSVENVIDSDVEVVGLRALDNSKQNFIIKSSDLSYVNAEQILGVLPFPTIKMKGERIYYHFEKTVPVLEDTFM